MLFESEKEQTRFAFEEMRERFYAINNFILAVFWLVSGYSTDSLALKIIIVLLLGLAVVNGLRHWTRGGEIAGLLVSAVWLERNLAALPNLETKPDSAQIEKPSEQP